MNVIAIDPGTANTGLVYMNERGVMCAKTIPFPRKDQKIGQDQYALNKRAHEIAERITDWMADKPHDVIVIEGFTSFGGRRAGANAFQTPYLCGFLQKHLEGEALVIQTSGKVLAKDGWGDRLRDELTAGLDSIPGARQLTNDHLRSAAVHGWYYLKGMGR